jgi:hypothetical protein
MAPIERKMLDRRTFDRYVSKGLVKQTEIDQHVKSLPDENNNATWVTIDLDEAEVGEGSEVGSEGAGSH